MSLTSYFQECWGACTWRFRSYFSVLVFALWLITSINSTRGARSMLPALVWIARGVKPTSCNDKAYIARDYTFASHEHVLFPPELELESGITSRNEKSSLMWFTSLRKAGHKLYNLEQPPSQCNPASFSSRWLGSREGFTASASCGLTTTENAHSTPRPGTRKISRLLNPYPWTITHVFPSISP